MKNVLFWILKTNIGRLVTSIGLSAFSLFLANWIDYMEWVALAFFLIFPLPYFFVAMAYAWVINPMKDYRDGKRIRGLVKRYEAWTALMIANGYNADFDGMLNKYLNFAQKLHEIESYKTPQELIDDIKKC